MEVKINREIRNYTESMFFGLSLRQFVFSLLAVGVAVLLYFVLKPYVGTETVSWMCILGAAPFAAMGFVNYNGMTAEQLQKLFEIVKGTRLELPVLVAAFYGLRRGEVLGLKWDAIDFNRGTLTIKRTVTEATIDGAMKIIEQDSAKTKSSLRTLPLVGSFRDYFQKVKEAQELNKKVCGNCYNYDYDGYVFVNELGERMRPNYLTEYFPKYIAKHGMPKMRFHDLRHSCASLLLANGVPLKQIQEWLGHSDFSTTANIYAHLDYRSKISSAQAMEQGMLLPRSDDFGSRWENVTEQDKITEPDLNPGF